jgi:anti-sigma-K factor RskA
VTPAEAERDRERSADAGEYVLGTLDAAAHADIERRLGTDHALRAEVYAWQDRLLGLTQRVAPSHPRAGTWTGIAARLTPQGPSAAAPPRAAAANDALWQRLRRWQALGALAMAASLLLAGLLVLRAPEPASARYLAVLQAPDDKSTGWVVELTADKVRLVPVAPTAAVPAGRALQFWTKPEGAAGPTSLGLVRAGVVTELPLARLPAVAPQTLFELTLEPEGGSPLDRPTGPILYVGRSVRL